MLIALHKNARTTPAVRAEIAASNEPASVLAQRFGITEQTVYKWKKREVFGDRSHTAHHLQTVLTPAQETVVVHLRRTLLLPLDDLLAVTREFICPHVSRSGLDRCLRRHGAGNLNALKPQGPQPVHKAFKSYEPGYVHMDVKYLPQMQDESSRRYLFVAIDRATRWVFVQFKANKTAASAQAFLKALHKACPLKITKLLMWCLRSKHQIIAFAARATDAKIVSALLCQTNGFGSWLWRSMYCRMACSNSPMLVWALRLIHLSLI